jgi:hypothetical protein
MGNNSSNTVSQSRYAEQCGVSRKTVTKWKERGLLVMAGELVDVEQSNAKLKRYRRGGLAKVTNKVTPEELVSRLREMDWKTDFAWSEAAQRKRAEKAANCIGLRVVTSNAPIGDGQWGGFQLRNIKREEREGLDEFTIWAGYGYELSPVSVIEYCREQVEGDPELIEHPDLLHSMARPVGPGDTPED